ncbi:helix-turn-helix domain-containing protein [Salipiger mucosus]|uniref:helix-turn-helix domain-containing protein n=1 Tax=Salipiger mucosus TaxID=263378 RepID=UPI00036087CB|nr:XRE family transcriptional regulator [Salipiger mucosus]
MNEPFASKATKTTAVPQSFAERLLKLRKDAGWSRQHLAGLAGVSQGMINKLERGQSSPTMEMVGKLSAAFGMTVSEIVAQPEMAELRVARQTDRATFFDPETRLSRETVSPDGSNTGMDVTKVVLPPHAEAEFPAEAYTFINQLIWVLEGDLTIVCGPETEVLGAGDCMSLGPPTPVTFRNPTDRYAIYAVIVRRR